MKHKTNFSQKKTVFRTSWFLIAGSLIVSLLVIAGLLQINQKRNEEVFQKLISEILSVSHQQQELEAINAIEDTQRSLEAIAAIYQTSGHRSQQPLDATYLTAIENFNTVRDIQYVSAQTLQSMVNNAGAGN